MLADKSNSSAVKLRRKSTAQKSDSFSEDVRQASGGGVGVGVGVRVGVAEVTLCTQTSW